MDTKKIDVSFECLVALTPKQWERVFDAIGSKLEELAFKNEEAFARGQRAWSSDHITKKALSEIYGALAEHFFSLRDAE